MEQYGVGIFQTWESIIKAKVGIAILRPGSFDSVGCGGHVVLVPAYLHSHEIMTQKSSLPTSKHQLSFTIGLDQNSHIASRSPIVNAPSATRGFKRS